MVKKILTFLILSFSICAPMLADTTEMDITSRFVKNADFESGKTNWTCSSGVGTENNNTFSTGTHLQTWKEDTKNRKGTVTSTAPKNVGTQSIKQTITLPQGSYKFKAQVISEHIKSTLYVKVGSDNEIALQLEDDTDRGFESIDFSVTNASSSVEIGYKTSGEASSSYQSGQGHNAWFAIDNVKLLLVYEKNTEKDLTAYLLNNPNFDNDKEGWTCGSETWIQNDKGLGTNSKFLQRWDGSVEGMHSQDNYQTVNLPKGVYRLSARIASEGVKSYLYANVASEDEYVYTADGINPSDHDVIFEVNGESRSVQLGYRTNGEPSSDYQSGWAAWHAIDNVKLEYLLEELDYSQIGATYNTYKAKADQLDEAGKASFAAATATIKADIDTNNFNYEKFVSYPAAIIAAYRAAVLAQTTENANMTDGLVNPKFDEGKTGWTCSDGIVVVESSQLFNVPFLEKWTNNPNAMGAQSISQSLTLHQGAYTLGAQVGADNLYANLFVQVGVTKFTTDCTNSNPESKEVSFVVPTDNTTVTIGYETEGNKHERWQSGWGIWFAMDNVTLTYNGDDYNMKYQAQQTAYATLMTSYLPLLATTHPVYTALKDLTEESVSITSQSEYEAKVATLVTAYERAVKYNQARADLDYAQSVVATTNIAYTGELETLERYYTAGTFEANNVNLPLDLGTRTWGMIPTILLGHNSNRIWANPGDYYINTWSTEGETDGSGFTTPFFEYWVENGTLAAKTITATVTGMTAGEWYGVTADVRVKTAAGNIPSGITLTVGGTGETDVCTGAPVATPNMYLGTFTAYGQADADGKVTVTFNVKADNNISWLSFKNVNIDAASATTIDYALGAEYGTIILPFAAAVPSGMTAYTCEAENNGTLTLAEATTFEANTPYIISGTTGSYSFSGVATGSATSYSRGWLTGVLANTPAPVGTYVLQNNADNGLGFYLVVSGKQPTVAANHAYLNAPAEVTIVPGSNSARKFFSLDCNATAIDQIVNSQSSISKFYNLQGQKVGRNYKGIVIINGKKIVK